MNDAMEEQEKDKKDQAGKSQSAEKQQEENNQMGDAMVEESEQKETASQPKKGENEQTRDDIDKMQEAASPQKEEAEAEKAEEKEVQNKPEEKSGGPSEKKPAEQEEKEQTSEESEKVEKGGAEKKETEKESPEPTPATENTEKNTADQDDQKEASKQNQEKSSQETTEPESDTDSEAEEDEKEKEKGGYAIEMKDYKAMNLDALTEELQRLLKNHDVKHIRDHVRQLKTQFDVKFGAILKEKKEEFLEGGGSIIDFQYSTPTKKEFDKAYFEYREKRDNYYKSLKKDLNKNLEERLAIIEELKNMVGGGGSMRSNFKSFKKLQERWKKAGPVPRDRYKRVANTYHHHVENFYDFLHLDREFRDMDFKHNLEQKLKMIARAEELAQEDDINRAFRELQMLHKMWKEDVGPVAREYREPIWEKFSAATKQIHQNRREYFKELDKKYEENFEKKKEIIAGIEEVEEGEIKSHGDAQKRIKKVKALRDEFFSAGKVPRKKNKETWNHFKEATREFNHKKNEFYKNLKQDLKENLAKKRELLEVAEANKDGEDFETVTPLMKKIQADWKKIGRVPRKHSDKIWKAFQGACNHYFDRLHAKQDKAHAGEREAFEKKKELVDETRKMELQGERKQDLAAIKEKIAQWKEIGQVPRKKRYIEKKFNKALDQLFKQLDIDKKEAEMLKYEKKVKSLDEAEDDRRIEKEENFLRKRVSEAKDEIRQLENNLEFFNSKDENNPLMKEALNNIDRHKEQLETWKAKLKKVRSL